MEKINVKVKKTIEKAVLPKIATEFSAGADLYACLEEENLAIKSGETVFVHTGLAVEIPVGYVGLVFARSSIACKRGLAPANKVGVIDSDYRGEIMVAIHNHSNEDKRIEDGERIAQMVIVPYLSVNYVLSDELDDTERGKGGFGSTGKK